MAKRRQTKAAAARPGKRSASRCGKISSTNTKKASTSAKTSTEAEIKTEEVITEESPALTDDLECAICADVYKEPKLLHCMHTFCGKCIEQLMKQQDDQQTVTCPICRYVSKAGLDGKLKFLRNHIVEQKVKWKEVASKRENNEIKCSECEAEAASKLCTDCSLKLCESCAAHHKRCVKYKDHSILSIERVSNEELLDRKPDLCPQHALELKLFCDTCQVSACSDCVHSSPHSRHLFLPLHKVMDAKLSDMNVSLEATADFCKSYEDHLRQAEQFCTKTKKEIEESKRIIEDSFSGLIELLMNDKRRLLDSLDKDGERADKALRKAQEKVNHLKSMASYLKEVSRHPKDQIFDIMKDGLSQLQYESNLVEASNRPTPNSLSNTHGENTNEKDGFDLTILASRIERSENQLLGIKSFLQKLGVLPNEKVRGPPVAESDCGFRVIHSVFPMPEGTVTFRLPNFSKINHQIESTHQRIGHFLWRIKVCKEKGKKLDDENNQAGCYLQCELDDGKIVSRECRASFRIILKSFVSNGNDVGFCRGTATFQLKNHSDNYGATFRKGSFSWESLVEKGVIMGDVVEIRAEVKIESWGEHGSK